MTKRLLKKNILLVASLSTLLSLMSCEYLLERHIEKEQQNNYTSRYMGNWIGTYTGAESGNISFKVIKNGYISGTYGIEDEIIGGAVLDDGGLLSVLSVNSGFHLYANLNQNAGTWKKGNKTGTWTFKKQ